MKLKKIKKEELKKLQDFELFFSEANKTLGKMLSEFEFAKSDIMRQLNEQYVKMDEFKKELSESYGEGLSINISTGEISEPE